MTGQEQLALIKYDLSHDLRWQGESLSGEAGYIYTLASVLAALDNAASTDSNPWKHFVNRLSGHSVIMSKHIAQYVQSYVNKWDQSH